MFHEDFCKIPMPNLFKKYNIFGMINKSSCAADLRIHGKNYKSSFCKEELTT